MVIFAGVTEAQLRYKGQWVTHLSGGCTTSKGFNFFGGIEKYFGNSQSSLLIGVDYSRNKHFIKIMDFDVSITTLSATYFYSLERLVNPPFFINLGFGGLLGFENLEKKEVPEGVIQKNGTKLIYGFVFRPQFEYLVSKSVSLYLETRVNYFAKTEFDKFTFVPSIGFKIYL